MSKGQSEISNFSLDFLVVGSRKCATSWLYEVMLQHPEITLSDKVKESRFFTAYYDRGLGWYHSLFRTDDIELLTGEIDPNNFASDEAPARIHALFPSSKIILIVRNPADMFFSAYDHEYNKGDTQLTPAKAWEQLPHLRQQLLYGKLLQNYLRYFPRQDMLIMFYEQLVQDKQAFLSDIQQFLGIKQAFSDAHLPGRVGHSRVSRFAGLTHLFIRVSRLMRHHNLHWLVNMVKRSGLFSWLYRDQSRKTVEQARQGELRREILTTLSEEMSLFKALSGLPVEKYWSEYAGSFDAKK